MAKPTDRRRFFKELLRSGAEVAGEVRSTLKAQEELGPALEPDDWFGNQLSRAEPVRHQVPVQQLLALCEDVGLPERWAVAVEELLRPSLRLTVGGPAAAEPGGSRLGGTPDLPPGLEWPRSQGQELAFLGQLDLAAVSARMPEAELPADGLLLFFYDVERRPSGLEPGHGASCRVVVAGAGQPLKPAPAVGPPFSGRSLALSRELTLPPAHSFHLDELDLDATEFAAWAQLRERLAELQGVLLEESCPDWLILHRLLGHGEPMYGREMELDCQLVANGLDLSDGEGYADARRDELEAGAAEWRLLLQLSSDPDLGWSWSEPFGRLYFWIHAADLSAGNFDRVRTILQ